MNKKVLFVANIHKHIRAFHIPYIQYLQKQGYEVHVAANDGATRVDEADKQYDLSIDRSPFSLDNIKAIRELRAILEKEKYCLVHCHTAMGSVVARLAAKDLRKNGLKVLYTAHGFHFFKGSPIKYWILYYPMEKYLSAFTDGIVTINQEDHKLLMQQSFKNKFSFLTNGMGINAERFTNTNISKDEIRKKNNYKSNDFLLLYIAEFIERKNHRFLVNCAVELNKRAPNIKILFAGRGRNIDLITNLIKERKADKIIDVLGYRTDIGEIIKMIDLGVSVSYQEGLPMNVAEQLYLGKPVVATKIRGHVDLIEHGVNGLLFNLDDQNDFINSVLKLYRDKALYSQMSQNAKIKSKKLSIEFCLEQMKTIYKNFLPE